jgi:7-carboxy-7-deazaguanine synthase
MSRRGKGLQIHEIYRSVQGEASFAGWPCTFVRTTGCELSCTYCDEPQALHGGKWLEIPEILAEVAEQGTELVELTGGEPLLQRAAPALCAALLDAGHRVLIETGGHRDISVLDPRVHVILDLKAPGSGMTEHNDYGNLERLVSRGELKLVVGDEPDYLWASALIRERGLEGKVPVHLSPVHGKLDPRALVEWILRDGLRVRLNLQLHKYIWGADAHGV